MTTIEVFGKTQLPGEQRRALVEETRQLLTPLHRRAFAEHVITEYILQLPTTAKVGLLRGLDEAEESQKGGSKRSRR